MTTFNYSTGDPTNLTAGATASMGDIKGSFDDVSTYLNGSGSPATLLGAYKTLFTTQFRFTDTALSSGTVHYSSLIPAASGLSIFPQGTGNTAFIAPTVFPFDPADHAVSGMTLKLRLKVTCLTGAVSPGTITFTSGLHAVTSTQGSFDSIGMGLGAAVSGSTVAVANPGTGARSATSGTDFTAPASGVYALGVNPSASLATDSLVNLSLVLQYRHI